MKSAVTVFIAGMLSFLSFGQQPRIQCLTHNEDNSKFPTSVCYNWNQLPNGEVFVSGNAGLFRFDGVNFTSFSTQGRGLAISSSVSDKNGRLWCNSFHGDVYYMKSDSLIRHSISDSLRGLTVLSQVGDQFFLRTENRLFEINTETFEIRFIKEFTLIRTLFDFGGAPYVLNSLSSGATELYNLKTQKSVRLDLPYAINSACRFLNNGKNSFLFFNKKGALVPVTDLMKGNLEVDSQLNYKGKINYITFVDEQVVICGMTGVNFYSLDGTFLKSILTDIQVTHFGKDLEGNYIATSMTEGLIIIPDINTFRYQYRDFLEHENIVQSEFDQSRYAYLGTNAGKLIRHDLLNNDVQTLELGLRSEISSMQLSRDGNELYIYCDALYIVDIRTFSVKKTFPLTSIKQMCLSMDGRLLLGTRKGVMLFENDSFGDIGDFGWVISILPLDQKSILVSSKNGLFLIDLDEKKSTRVHLNGIESDRTISHLTYLDGNVYFIYDYQYVYRCNKKLDDSHLIYQSSSNDLSGMLAENDEIVLFKKGEVIFFQGEEGVSRSLTNLHGLNERRTIDFYELRGKSYFIHNESASIFSGSPQISRVLPELAFQLLPHSTFQGKNGLFESHYDGNELVFRLRIQKALRSQGNLKVFYRFGDAKSEWKKIENPFDEIRLERIPIGSGQIQFKAINEVGRSSKLLTIPYAVTPPFYLTTWFFIASFLMLVIIVFFLVKWRVRVVRKKTLERLRKQKLESRALNAELTAIRSQMNPHFIFNVLTAIQAKVIQGKVDEAYVNIGDFATLIRNVLEKSGKEYITLEEEMALMKNYVELENSRLARPVQFEIEYDDPEFFEDLLIPTLITQPLIENSIKHAFSETHEEPTIQLIARRIEDGFKLSVIDNGVGLELHAKTGDHSSFALSALRKRIRSLSQTAAYTISLNLLSNQSGTQAVFVFKFK